MQETDCKSPFAVVINCHRVVIYVTNLDYKMRCYKMYDKLTSTLRNTCYI